MRFKLPVFLDQKYLKEEMDCYEVVMDTEDAFHLRDLRFPYVEIGHYIYYRRLKNNGIVRTDILADLSKDYDFQLTEERFEILNPIFGLVETERTITSLSYFKDSIQDISCGKDEDFLSFFTRLQSFKKPDFQNQHSYFRMVGEYGLDFVINEKGERFSLLSSSIFMDDAIERDYSFEKQK